MKTLIRVIISLFLASHLLPAQELSFDKFEAVPVQDNGRRKPFRTFATESLQTLSGKTQWTLPGATGKSDALHVITSLWLEPDSWREHPVIRINHKALKEQLGLPVTEKAFSYQSLSSNPRLWQLLEQIAKGQKQSPQPKLTPIESEARNVGNRLLLFESIADGTAVALVPDPHNPEARWNPAAAAREIYPGAAGEAVASAFEEFTNTFRSRSPQFASASEKLAGALSTLNPAAYPSDRTIGTELIYGKLHPFRWAWILYLLAAIVLWLTKLVGQRTGYAIAWTAMISGFLFQIIGFICRIIISGRAPVTNMYESVVWVAFGTVLFAMILEAIYRCRYFLMGAAAPACVALVLADTQTAVLDSSIHPLQAVLRDNFWLSTHVTSITLGYAAFLLALGVAHIILFKSLRGGRVTGAMHNYLYRSLQIGVLLLATGTILGGVWANYSWGRFWDWDPKETWALIALLGYLFLLHGRIVGWWGGFGLAVGAIIAFQSIVMAWYGVNFVLGVGLHSYGFGTGGFPYMAGFCAIELAFVAFAALKALPVRTAEPIPAAAADNT
jgi:ABC-type transport system involved in cytochrome c biogenesis permease subunit